LDKTKLNFLGQIQKGENDTIEDIKGFEKRLKEVFK
jgi:hypothetical protein